ncbi:MAG: PPC domain-containing protein [Pirellulaceae bacterium]|jgi:hypothetical protein|nr:PPC domain-containing protein [Pirellulaceae bacterium]
MRRSPKLRQPIPTTHRCAVGAPVLIACFALCAPATLQAAPPKLTSFYPAGGERGKTTSVTAAGEFPNWPVDVEVDGDGLTLKPTEKKGVFEAVVDANARTGVRMLRVFDKGGSSEFRPFVVGGLPEVGEAEPNDDSRKPQIIEGSAVVNGKLQKGGDVDIFEVSLRKGQTLVAAVLANRVLASPMDPVMQICDADGFVLAQNDDERGIDPLLVFPAPRDGKYLVRLFAFPLTPNSTIGFSGADTYIYRLTATTGGFLDHALPMSSRREKTDVELFGWNLPDGSAAGTSTGGDRPQVEVTANGVSDSLLVPVVEHELIVAAANASRNEPQDAPLPCTISGRIEDLRDEDGFRFAVKKGEQIELQVESFALGYPLDPHLSVWSDGKMLKESDDTSRSVRDTSLVVAAPADGHLVAVVKDTYGFGGFRHVYRIVAKRAAPDYRLTTPGALSVAAGKSGELEVAIERLHKFAKGVSFEVSGAPEGVTVEAPQVDGKAKSVKIKITATDKAQPGHAILRIRGRSDDEAKLERTARYAAGSRKLDAIRLTITE